MNKIRKLYCIVIVTLAYCNISTSTAQAQSAGIHDVLKSIEANNKELKAHAQLTASQKLEVKTANNLPDPTLSYAHLWGAGDATITEMIVSQSFDFPTLYADRNKLNKLKMSAFDSQAETFRRDILLQAHEVCLDIILLRQQKAILDERLKNARELSAMYAEKLALGEANIIETNKVKLELLNVMTEAKLNESALQNKCQELTVLNGNVPITFNETYYPLVSLPTDYEQLRKEILSSDYALLTLQRESEVADKQVSINRSQWLPKLEVGYRRNTEAGEPFNGVVVGFSIPLFENRNKVKMAKSQSMNLNYQKESATLQLEVELSTLYQEAVALRSLMNEYEGGDSPQSGFQAVDTNVSLLREALEGGEISMIDYFVEIAVVYQSKLNYLQLQNQFQKVMARMYRNRL